MPRTKKKRKVELYLSVGPLPDKYADQYRDHLLVFCDASKKRYGGLAAVLFDGFGAEPEISTSTIAPSGSNGLELQAVILGLQLAEQRYPGRSLVLFTDNQDAVSRLTRKKALGVDHDAPLSLMLEEHGIANVLGRSEICWIKSHWTSRGNALADQYARKAAD